MALYIPLITAGQAATLIHVIILFLQYTLGLALVALLIYFIPPVNSALAWNVIGRSLHASLWPTLLRTYSSSARCTGFRVALFSYLSFAVTVLVAFAGVIMPLGLSTGPVLQASPKSVPAVFVEDTSPLGLATSPRATEHTYMRECGLTTFASCPDSHSHSAVVPPETVAKFKATPYSPFGIEFRRYFITTGEVPLNYTVLYSHFSSTESLILRTGMFAVGGLVVDMDNPGIGLWNHTLPTETPNGGVWSADVLWLEPVSACVDANITVDYMVEDAFSADQPFNYNLTDRGGFFNLTHVEPELYPDAHSMDLWQHAYMGAVLSNSMAMQLNNLTRNESYYGRTFPLPVESLMNAAVFGPGTMQLAGIPYLQPGPLNSSSADENIQALCQGYGDTDTANITNIAVNCYTLLAPPQRSDGGDTRLPANQSTWTQRIYSCAGATRARMQHVEFSSNGTMDLSGLGISRRDIDSPVLWATEKTEFKIRDIDIFWGRIPDSLERDSSLWTTRSDVFYIPAGVSDSFLGASTLVNSPQTSTLPSLAWAAIKQFAHGQNPGNVMDYTALSNFALMSKFQSLISTDPQHGPSQILNLIWTDLMANNALGTDSRSTLLVRANVPSIAYDLRFAIPALILLVLWVPLFGAAAVVTIGGLLKFSRVRHLLNHTGAGRIALGNSALRPVDPDGLDHCLLLMQSEDEKDWAMGEGRTLVCIQPLTQPSKRDVPASDSGSSMESVPLSTEEK
ncbi:hypothetical protein B0H13DRAFT_1705846 [Mycena leptocephala]|nr:hypothetical protein B0H13DRAFT_1705846 [Mycena leptocephala]